MYYSKDKYITNNNNPNIILHYTVTGGSVTIEIAWKSKCCYSNLVKVDLS